MIALLAAVLFVVPLDAPFVSAEASAIRVDGDMMWVDVRVETLRTPSVVLVRAIGPDDQPLEPVALEAQGNVWSARVFLPRRSDIRLSFEHIDAEGFSFVSRPAGLIELGVDAALFSLDSGPIAVPAGEEEPAATTGDRSRWLWLALGLLAAAGALLLVTFSRPPREQSSSTQVTSDEE